MDSMYLSKFKLNDRFIEVAADTRLLLSLNIYKIVYLTFVIFPQKYINLFDKVYQLNTYSDIKIKTTQTKVLSMHLSEWYAQYNK